MIITAKIIEYKDGKLILEPDEPIDREIEQKDVKSVEIRLNDGRLISVIQRKKVFGLIRDISIWSGHEPEYLRQLMTWDFISKNGLEWFSLSKIDMTTARHFLPKLIAAQLLRVLEDNLVAKKICNMDTSSEIKKKGDTVTFVNLTPPTIKDYTGTVSYENMATGGVNLVIDQSKYYAFTVDDIESLQSAIDLKSGQVEQAAYALQKIADQYVLGLYAQAGNTVAAAAAITPANILAAIGEFATALAEKNVPEKDMWITLPPWAKTYLSLAGVKFQVNNGTNGKGTMAYTDQLGFDVYVSNNIKTTGSGATAKYNIMGGSYNSIVYAEQILDSEIIRLESKFADGARGLHVYGAKVVKPAELATSPWERGASTI